MSIPDSAAPSIDVEKQELIDSLVRVSFGVTAVLSRVAAEYDLSLTQLRVLAILRDRRVRMSELASYLGLDRSTLSGLVDRAERRGLVQREPNPDDGRAVDVFLTTSGAQLARQGAEQIAGALSPTIRQLTKIDARRLAALLQQLLRPAGP